MEEYDGKGRILRCELDAAIKLKFPGTEMETRTIDVSENGLRFHSLVEIPLETQLEVELESTSICPGREKPIYMTAKVNSLVKTENGYQVGIQFVEISDEDKKTIADYLQG